MTARVVLVIAALLATGAPAAAHATAPALAGTTVVTAGTSSRMTVQVPAGARISNDPEQAVSFDGPGRLVGLVLREQRDESPDEATYLRLPSMFGHRVYGWTMAGQDDGTTAGPSSFTLHHGLYTLYVLADGAPVTVTLHLLNLGGSVDLAPATRTGSATVPMRISFDPATSSGVTWSGGAAVQPTGPADLFTLVWWRQDDATVADDGACWYDSDGIEELGAMRWVPGCPGGTSVSSPEVAPPGSAWSSARGGQRGGLAWASIPAAQEVGIGYWSLAKNIHDVGGIAVWLGR